MLDILHTADIKTLKPFSKGKVRELFEIDDDHLLIVTTDRISAFDIVLPSPIPGKGAILTAVSGFWFAKSRHLIANHLTSRSLADVLPDPEIRASLEGRATVVKRLKPLPIEAIVRGYLVGSGWRDYKATGSVCGLELPGGLKLADRLPNPIFTPSTKAKIGDHDENITFKQMQASITTKLADEVKEKSLALYTMARDYALQRGIIIADTKFEFGLDSNGKLVLIDEILTPDSSRFWPTDQYLPGSNPPSFDKQFVRDYLESSGWDKTGEAPVLPDEIVQKTAQKYREAKRRLTEE